MRWRKSVSYCTVHRKPIRSFFEGDEEERNASQGLLRALKEATLGKKIRLFIIDPKDVKIMNADFDGPMKDQYLEKTGDVKTYWMTTEGFRDHFPFPAPPPDDFGLFDDILSLRYNPDLRTVRYAIAEQVSIFQQITESQGLVLNVFRTIEPSQKSSEPPR